jgi:hypothetical protein
MGIKKRGVRVVMKIRERVLLLDNSRVYCLIKGWNQGKLALVLKIPDVKVNVCNTILLIFTPNPCSTPLIPIA